MKRGKQEFRDNESGAVAVYVAIGLVVFLGFAALAIDVGKIVYTRRALARAAEAGALAGARGLWPLVLPVHSTDVTVRTGVWSTGESKAISTTAKNLPTPTDSDVFTDVVTVEVGRWDYISTFTVDHGNPNAVRVTIRRNNVPTIFSKVLMQQPINIERSATAVMDFAIEVGKGCLPIAVNLDNAKVPGDTVYIGFNPDPEDNGGWFALDPDDVNANTIKNYIKYDSVPPVKVGDTIDLQNGVIDAALALLKAELANHPDGWLVFLPAVDTPKFNHTDQVDSFVAVMIPPDGVKESGSPKYVKGEVLALGLMEAALPGPLPPGGVPVGALAPPKLVQ
jgi:hypothetical protein